MEQTFFAEAGGYRSAAGGNGISVRQGLRSRFFQVFGALALATTAASAQSLTVNFDTQYLGTFASPQGSGYGVWSNGQTVSADNIWVSFQNSASGNFSATIQGQTLAYSTTTNNWTYGNQTYTSVMSPSFTVSQLNQGGGFTVNEVNGQNLFIEYGTNTIGGSTPPGVGAPARYNDVEWTYNSGSANNNADLTYINNVGAALQLKYVSTSTNATVAFKSYTSNAVPYIAGQSPASTITAASSSTGTPSINSSGNYVAGIQGASSYPPASGFFLSYPNVIANAMSGNVSSPLLTNIPGGSTPTTADYVLGAGFDGTVSSISSNASLYQLSMAFTPSFVLQGDGTYEITFSGTVKGVVPGWTGNATQSVNYGSTIDPLKITVSGGNSSFYGYLSNGNVNQSLVTLGGNATAWAQFSTDFYNGGASGGGGSGSQAAPNSAIAGGGSSTSSLDYGQIVQRALGDLQELMMIGAFGNTNMGFGNNTTTMIGDIASYDIWQDKAYAYATGNATEGFNPIGKYFWINSEYSLNGNSSDGAIYSNPYDDRFGQGVYLPIDPSGGTLTIQLREVDPVPEPSAMVLLVIAAGAFYVFNKRKGSKAAGGVDESLSRS